MNRDEIKARLKAYIRTDQPFGPPDAADIQEPECSAALYDWRNRAFRDLINGSDIIVGRRGSGKSSLLKTFSAREQLTRMLSDSDKYSLRHDHNIGIRSVTETADIIIAGKTWKLLEEMELQFPQGNIKVEHATRIWENRIWMLVGETLIKHSIVGDLLSPEIRDYIDNSDLRKIIDGSLSHGRVTDPAEYAKEIQKALERARRKVLVTFDNEELHSFTPGSNAAMAGLIAASGRMIAVKNPVLDIKLCLPAEMFDELKKSVFRPDKDLHKVQFLHWNAQELLHLAARRLLVYLELHNKDEYDLVYDTDLNSRAGLHTFWMRYFPAEVTNSNGHKESTFTYILRHTQLLPRQLILILNAICSRRALSRPSFFRAGDHFDNEEIVKGIEDTEEQSKDAILRMYQPLYPKIHDLFERALPRLTREIEYGSLQSIWQSNVKHLMEEMGRWDFHEFCRLMLSTGALGVKAEDQTTQRYEVALFQFNSKYLLQASDKDVFCVHPMFSRIYNVRRHPSGRTILARGSDYDMTES